LQSVTAGTCAIPNYKPSLNVRSQFTVKDPNTGTVSYRPFVVVFAGSEPMVSAVDEVAGTKYLSGTQAWSTQYQQNVISESSGGTLHIPTCGYSNPVAIYVGDINFNTLPFGTSITITTSKGSIVGTSSYVIGNSTARAFPSTAPNSGQSNVDPSLFGAAIEIQDDGSLASGVCTPAADTSGQVKITVTTPLQITHTIAFPVSN
jgi:hypothetical protein